ncbi:hypothetical protein Chor_006998 [Crotalus horridus]
MDTSLPPEDQDSSGDDDDSFSGLSSGIGSSIEDEVIVSNLPLQESTNTSLMPEVSTSLRDIQTKVQVTDSPVEDYSSPSVFIASIPGFPDTSVVSKEPPVTLEELDSTTEPDTTKPTVLTTSIPIVHHVSTARITTSRAASTVKFIDIHDISNIDETHSFGIVPESERNLNNALPTMVSSTARMESSPLPENDIFQEYGSGGQDPKDVYKGLRVIAGGLVGLLFAGFLVAFMLYRMKKKDEGSYSLDEPKQSNGGYQKPHKQEEFYA